MIETMMLQTTAALAFLVLIGGLLRLRDARAAEIVQRVRTIEHSYGDRFATRQRRERGSAA